MSTPLRGNKPVSEERSWNWTEKMVKKVPASYTLLILIILVFLVYVIYMFSLSKVGYGPDLLDLHQHIIILDVFILIIYLLAGVQYFTNNMRRTFEKLEAYPERKKYIDYLYNNMERKFTRSKVYYVIVAMVVVPFMLIPIPEKSDFFYFSYPTIWSIFIDIINYVATLLILYLISTIIWIILNVSWALHEIKSDYYRDAIKIDLFSSDNVGGLRPIRKLILNIAVYQFVAISLGIINFVAPNETFNEEIALLIIMFLIVIYIFLKGWLTIDFLLEDERKREIDAINRLYWRQNQRIQEIISKETYENDENTLSQILELMEMLSDQRERVMNGSKNIYSIKIITTFLSSSILPIVTFVITYMPSLIRLK